VCRALHARFVPRSPEKSQKTAPLLQVTNQATALPTFRADRLCRQSPLHYRLQSYSHRPLRRTSLSQLLPWIACTEAPCCPEIIEKQTISWLRTVESLSFTYTANGIRQTSDSSRKIENSPEKSYG